MTTMALPDLELVLDLHRKWLYGEEGGRRANLRGANLREKLRTVSVPFGALAEQMFNTLPRNPERTVALRKLLEAKDAAVRAVVAS